MPTSFAFSMFRELVSVSIAQNPFFSIWFNTNSNSFFELRSIYFTLVLLVFFLASLSVLINEFDFNLSEVDLNP